MRRHSQNHDREKGKLVSLVRTGKTRRLARHTAQRERRTHGTHREGKPSLKLLLTGVPGTGKTFLAGYLSRFLDVPLISITDIVRTYRLWKGKGPYGSSIVNCTLLEKKLNAILRTTERVIVEGHLGSSLRLDVNEVIVLRTRPRTLMRRLCARAYPPEKVYENILAEALDDSLLEAERHYGPSCIRQLDTTNMNRARRRVLALISGKERGDEVNWSSDLSSLATREKEWLHRIEQYAEKKRREIAHERHQQRSRELFHKKEKEEKRLNDDGEHFTTDSVPQRR